MENNKMFCYQCEQTAGGKGCTVAGVCGKTAEVSKLQDLLIYEAKGIGCYMNELASQGKDVPSNVIEFVENALFTTLTNVNFDVVVHVDMLKTGASIKASLREMVGDIDVAQAKFVLPATKEEMLNAAVMAGIMYNKDMDEDIRSIRETILYAVKGISAYAHQARILKYNNAEVDKFYGKVLSMLCDDSITLNEYIALAMETGTMTINIMKTLDDANTSFYGHPTPQKVNVNKKKGPFIIVSGHDLRDLEMLLEQTKDKGVNVYTHGEMLPSHGYPELKKYDNLVGNFGSAWQNQQTEFDNIPGCILMTTNCLIKPKDSYSDRIYTTSVVGWENLKYIPVKEDGTKDFTEIINQAIELGGFTEDEETKEILVGFGHNSTLSQAPAIIDAVKTGKIKHFFLIGGCDGFRKERSYYTDFAQNVPQDCVILTLACGKYRFNKLNFGNVPGTELPRLLDVGQCNDAYSAVKIATALADAFECGVNDLPLSIVLSWFEQKAVADLLALLSLGIKGIYLGPTLPAFLSPNVINFLVSEFDIKPISNYEDDLKACLSK